MPCPRECGHGTARLAIIQTDCGRLLAATNYCTATTFADTRSRTRRASKSSAWPRVRCVLMRSGHWSSADCAFPANCRLGPHDTDQPIAGRERKRSRRRRSQPTTVGGRSKRSRSLIVTTATSQSPVPRRGPGADAKASRYRLAPMLPESVDSQPPPPVPPGRRRGLFPA